MIKLFKKVALDGGDCRMSYFIDSHVAKSALCRGRSASSSLQPLLKRACSWCLAFGLYPAGRFAPTRLNPADHPTRNKQIPDATASSLWKALDLGLLFALSRLRKLRRWECKLGSSCPSCVSCRLFSAGPPPQSKTSQVSH